MSQKIKDKADVAEARTHEASGFMQQIRSKHKELDLN
jgi:hypothetical protein